MRYDTLVVNMGSVGIVNEDILLKTRGGTKFSRMKHEEFSDALKNPESGIRGFLRPLPQDIFRHIRSKRYKKFIEESGEYNLEFLYFTPVYNEVGYGAIIGIDKSKTNIPHTWRFYEIYGKKNKGFEWAMDFRNVIEVDTIVPKRIEFEYSEKILSVEEIKQIVEDSISTEEKLKHQILAHLLGGSPVNELGKTSGTFTTLYPWGEDYHTLDLENVKRFISDFYFPFTIDFNRGKKEFIDSCFYSRKKTEVFMPDTSFQLYTERCREVSTFLNKRGTIDRVVDGVIDESTPFIRGPYNSKTEIPALVHRFDAELRDYSDILDEIRSSVMFYKLKSIEDKTELDTRVEVFDESLIELVKLETGQEEIVDFLTRRDTILDPNIGYGRYENTLRFSTAANKEKGFLSSKGLQGSSKIIGQTIADMLNRLIKNSSIKDSFIREIEIIKRIPVDDEDRRFMKAFHNTVGTQGSIIDFDELVKEYSKTSGLDIEIAKERGEMKAETCKNLGYIREVSPGKWMFTKWFEKSERYY